MCGPPWVYGAGELGEAAGDRRERGWQQRGRLCTQRQRLVKHLASRRCQGVVTGCEKEAPARTELLKMAPGQR